MTITKVYYYLCTSDGAYYYAAWSDDELDHNDEVPEGNDPEEYLALEFPDAEIRQVPTVA